MDSALTKEVGESESACADGQFDDPETNAVTLPPSKPPPKQKPCRTDKSWWRSLTDCDPISLEPLSELAYPPFELANDENGRALVQFDGQVLANYIVSTGVFENPLSRRSLPYADCKRLDEYLHINGLGAAGVGDAFRLRQMITTKVSNGASADQAVRLQREATTMLHSLFQFRQPEMRGAGATASANHSTRVDFHSHQEGGLTVIDDDEAPFATSESQQSSQFTASLPQLTRESEFPSLPSRPRTSAVAEARVEEQEGEQEDEQEDVQDEQLPKIEVLQREDIKQSRHSIWERIEEQQVRIQRSPFKRDPFD
jgi:hypothetical protein